MQRYLMHVSYIGTNFRGAQKIVNRNESVKFDPTIQGCLENALYKLRPANDPIVILSSRTDAGVHALHSTVHVDLLRPNSQSYEADKVTTTLNKYFSKEDIHIRVLKTDKVSNKFHCRYNAKSRTYSYRFAVLKDKCFSVPDKHFYHIPIEEHGRCHFVCIPNFDYEKMKSAVQLFLGVHDFRTFMGRGSHRLDKITRRDLIIDVNEGTSSACLDDSRNLYDYWNITCKSSGFLYNQVRRIVGTLIAVGQGKVTNKEVECMLQVPSHLSWNPKIKPAPSHGLYLCEVKYSPDDLEENLIL